MKFVVVTGMSGGGKTTALKFLEDSGYYCVDNLPVSLIEKFIDLVTVPNKEIENVALGIDVRAGHSFENVLDIFDKVKKNGVELEILFMEADEDTLIKRYKATKRVHPLAPDGRVEDGVKKERELLKEIRKKADFIIDSTNLLSKELKAEIDNIFLCNKEYNNLMVTVMSFGFKNGLPQDADLIFDVRFLPNPYYVDELRGKTGMDSDVQEYVLGGGEGDEFLDKLEDLVKFLIPKYIKEGKYRLVVGIGCTGGRHRSVTIANELYKRLKNKDNYGLKLFHRDAYGEDPR